MHYITANPWPDADTPVEISFKNRHTPAFTPGTLARVAPDEFVLRSAEPVQGIAPGQFAVIYDRDHRVCVGSGIITGAAVQL